MDRESDIALLVLRLGLGVFLLLFGLDKLVATQAAADIFAQYYDLNLSSALVYGAGVLEIAAPWLLDGIASPLAVCNGVICGALLIVLALPRGRIRDSYAGWDRYAV
ncbi:MAG: DoxX family membrane protein [Gammaproteobacteria bacterium]|nr:DoxX family membrane protein [Gammaproteobacteria bacterium]